MKNIFKSRLYKAINPEASIKLLADSNVVEVQSVKEAKRQSLKVRIFNL